MRRPALLSAIGLLTTFVAAQAPRIPWVTDPEVVVPASSDRPILLFFHRAGELPSERMWTWTFTDPSVAGAMAAVTPISVRIDRRPALAQRFGVTQTPALVLITPRDEVVARHVGVLEADVFLGWLSQHLRRIAPRAPSPQPPPTEPTSPFLEATPEPVMGSLPPPVLGEGDQAVVPRHLPVRIAEAGADIPIQVLVPGGADSTTLHHRPLGTGPFTDVRMSPSTPDLFFGAIPSEAVTRQGVEYYITIVRGGQSVTLPPEGPGRPHIVGVR